jgi:cell division protein FtsL
MGNRRIILFLLTAIAVCALLLWRLHVQQQTFGVQENTVRA